MEGGRRTGPGVDPGPGLDHKQVQVWIMHIRLAQPLPLTTMTIIFVGSDNDKARYKNHRGPTKIVDLVPVDKIRSGTCDQGIKFSTTAVRPSVTVGVPTPTS